METILARDMVRDYTSDYAMYVAQDRAVPAVIDGLKPVQRRCINSAHDLKLYHNKKHLKVSKLSGDVLGNYHPHGGANPVLMAQDFRFRYPLFEGQGNYGSPDSPNSYAAARYLEIRLSKFCEDFYLESADHADKEDNYDGRLKETTLYYPSLPGCLFTGASGIAVGFSTEIPTHTITDIGKSLLYYISDPSSGEYLEGLYPETCEKSIVVTPLPDIRKLYETGEGSVRYKASTHYETIDGKSSLVVDAFPPGFSKKRLEHPSILDAVDKGLLEVSNESSENIRYVFTSPDKQILENLEERLTSSVGYRMYIEHRGVIRLYKLREIYDVFLEEKSAFIVRKYSSLIKNLTDESEYLRVLLALKNDKKYIKNMFDRDSDTISQEIQDRYKTNETVSRRVLNTSLRSLMQDNLESIEEKLKILSEQIASYESYVNNPLDKIILDINSLLNEYKDDPKRARHIDENLEELVIQYRGNPLTVLKNKSYFIGYTNNTVSLVHGSDLPNLCEQEISIASADKEYYFLYDDKGCCTMTRDLLQKVGSRFNSGKLKGIIGINSLEDISIEQGNGKIYHGVSWSLRQKSSYIRLSKEDEPDFKVLRSPLTEVSGEAL